MLRRGRGDLVQLAAQPGDLLLAWAQLPGGPAELAELGVLARQAGRRGQLQHRDGECGQPLGQLAGVVGLHHQVRLFGDDRLDVGLVAGQLGARRLPRVVGQRVDRLDLAAGADRVQHLGRGGRQRDDRGGPGGNVHRAVGGRDTHREGGAGPRRGRAGAARLGTATACHGGRQAQAGHGHGQPARNSSHDHPPAGHGGCLRPLRCPQRHRNEPPFLRGQRVGAGQASGLIPRGHHRCGTAPESHRLRWAPHHPGATRDSGTLPQAMAGIRAAGRP